jgi:N6-adenosine-specific RNA methylase IME4
VAAEQSHLYLWVPNGGGVGFYFRNVTEMVLLGTKGDQRTLDPCPYLELFARQRRDDWTQWGDELDKETK